MKYRLSIKNSLRSWSSFLVEFLKILAVSAGVMHILLVAFVCLSRLSYPYELEWFEGTSLVQVGRILAGELFYSPLSVNNVSVIYMPLYYYISALLASFTGLSFMPLRVISFLSSVGIGIIVFFIVKNETRSNIPGIIAAGTFAAAFKLTSYWYDIARTDMLAVFFLFAAILSLRSERRGITLLSGILFGAAFFTKQTTLPFFLAMMFYVLIFERKKLFWATLSFSVIFALGWGILSLQNGQWFTYYTFLLPANHGIELHCGSVLQGLQFLFGHIFFVMIILLAWFSSSFKNIMITPSNRYYWFVALTASGLSMLAYLNRGGWINNLTPAFTSYAILFGIGMDTLANKISNWKNPRALKLFLCLLWFGCSIQFVALRYHPTAQIPTNKDLQAGNMLIRKISALNGDVLILRQNYLALLAGKLPFVSQNTLAEIAGNYGQNPAAEWKNLEAEINQSIKNKRFTAIILESPDIKIESLLGCFKREIIEYASDTTFFPIEGDVSRPTVIYTVCQD